MSDNSLEKYVENNTIYYQDINKAIVLISTNNINFYHLKEIIYQ